MAGRRAIWEEGIWKKWNDTQKYEADIYLIPNKIGHEDITFSNYLVSYQLVRYLKI